MGIQMLRLVLLVACLAGPLSLGAERGDLALVGGKLYPSPQSPAIDGAVIGVRDGKIAAVGKRGEVEIPKSAKVIDYSGKAITAGFWNSHVHFYRERTQAI